MVLCFCWYPAEECFGLITLSCDCTTMLRQGLTVNLKFYKNLGKGCDLCLSRAHVLHTFIKWCFLHTLHILFVHPFPWWCQSWSKKIWWLTKIVPSHKKSNKWLEWIKWLVHNSYKNKESAHLCSRLLQNLNSNMRLLRLSKQNSYLKSYLVHGTSDIVKDIFARTLSHHLSEFVHLGSWMIYFTLIFNSVCMC